MVMIMLCNNSSFEKEQIKRERELKRQRESNKYRARR